MAEKLIKQVLAESSKKKENILEFLNVTNEEILLSEGKFHGLIKARKEQCMLRYAEYLNKQELLLKQEYISICEAHTRQYDDTSLYYHEEKLSKRGDDFVLKKKEILDTIHAIENKSLERKIISLSEDFDFVSVHPLGRFEVMPMGNVKVRDPPASTITTNVDVIKKKNDNRVTAEDPSASTITTNVDVIKKKNDSSVTADVKDLPSGLQVGGQEKKSTIPSSPSVRQVQPYFDILIGNKRVGRLIFNLYEDIAPITCRNFIGLCKHGNGYGYMGSCINWVMPRKYCYGGLINTGSGRNEYKSFFGEPFECEKNTKTHDKAGLLSMGNKYGRGYHDSWFMITFNPQPQLDDNNVVFGEVTEKSKKVLKEIEFAGTYTGTPTEKIYIAKSHVLQDYLHWYTYRKNLHC